MAIIPAAGLGTRLLPVTKEQPKEMLSVFTGGTNVSCSLKPVVQLIFEEIWRTGIREFCFVVGRGKRGIEDHFTPDLDFVRLLRSKGRRDQALDLLSFYRQVSKSTILWMNQSTPLGFGHAVLLAKAISGGKPVLVHAGDNHVMSASGDHLRRMLATFRNTGADATLLLRIVKDPRRYGVADIVRHGKETLVKEVVEKPEKPASHFALLPAYIFKPAIFDALESIAPGKGGELQLTDGIQKMIERGLKVTAVQLKREEFWLDVGTPETYWQALKMSHSRILNG